MAKTKVPPADPRAPAAPARPDAEYTVVARRYRPRQLADLVGQEHVAAALTNAITSGRIAHAYLFTGARGVGKTSTARILAKCLNCETGPTPTPCDACDICKSIAAGDDVDAVEIDGASNNKVDEARELRSNVGFRPQRARYKVYIIDEVHMLSTAAFNALLKTLEEPPPHVKFILATTEVQKLPITILSRCQRFDFAHIGPAKVFATLKHIVAKEGLKADDDALQIVARRAAGSMRDAQTLLDQLLGFSDGILTAEKVHVLLGTAGDDRVGGLAGAILGRDARRAVELVGEAAEQGLQLGELLDQLIDYWRGLMLAQVTGDGAKDLPGTSGLHEQIRKHAAAVTLDTVLAGLDVLTATKAKFRGSPHVQVLLEVVVVRLSRMDELLSVTQLAQVVANGASFPSNGTAVRTPPAIHSGPSNSSKKKLVVDVGSTNGTHATAATANGQTTQEVTETNWPGIWERVLQEVGLVRAQHLRAAGLPAILGPNTLVLRFPSDYSSAYDACATDAGQQAIRQTLRKVTGKEWVVRLEKGAAASPTANGAAVVPSLLPARRPGRNELLELPLFKKAADALGAQFIKADEGFDPQAGATAAADTGHDEG